MAKLNNYDYDFYYSKFYGEMKSTNEIAAELGVASSSVVRRMKKLGINFSRKTMVKCANCSKDIERYIRCANLRNNLYCGKECDNEHRKVLMSGKNNHFYGRKHKESTKEVFSSIHKGKEIPLEMRKRISKKLSGQGSPHWNGGSSERNRNDRLKMEYRIWRKEVFDRDNYTCQCCFMRGGQLQVHHIENFSTNKELRTEIDNGIVLCLTCHLKFHSIYGKKNNTREQLLEFKGGILIESK